MCILVQVTLPETRTDRKTSELTALPGMPILGRAGPLHYFERVDLKKQQAYTELICSVQALKFGFVSVLLFVIPYQLA